jgi:hypothetical protein
VEPRSVVTEARHRFVRAVWTYKSGVGRSHSSQHAASESARPPRDIWPGLTGGLFVGRGTNDWEDLSSAPRYRCQALGVRWMPIGFRAPRPLHAFWFSAQGNSLCQTPPGGCSFPEIGTLRCETSPD